MSAAEATSGSRKAARILDAASSCFAAKGFQSATVEEIAGIAGVSRPLVYKHFGDKDGLIDAALEAAFHSWLAFNDPPVEQQPGGASAALAARFVDAVEFARARPLLQTILRRDPQVVFSHHAEALRHCHARSRERTLRILESGIATGELRADLDIEAAADSVEMILFLLIERALGIRPGQSLESPLRDATIDIVVAGLRAPAAEPRPTAERSGG
jgi:AcrR family transcriptional regulator